MEKLSADFWLTSISQSKKIFMVASSLTIIVLLMVIGWYKYLNQPNFQISGAPPYGESESEIPPLTSWEEIRRHWVRPSGPPKVALQIGHLDNDEVPEELKNIRGNTGAMAAGYTEVEVNQIIADLTAHLLKEKGVVVEILPATIPPDYWADVFIAIHADGSLDTTTTGYKMAAPWRDLTGKANQLVSILEESYGAATNLVKDDNITRNMRGYYAFAWWRYEHSLHPMTTAAIVETGFLTNPQDRRLIVDQPELSAKAIADGIMEFLSEEDLLVHADSASG